MGIPGAVVFLCFNSAMPDSFVFCFFFFFKKKKHAKSEGSHMPLTSKAHPLTSPEQSAWKDPTVTVEQIFTRKGLTSADRSNKATLPLTVPPCIQVIYKGFTPAHIVIAIHRQAALAFPPGQPSLSNVVHRPQGTLFKLLVTYAGQHHRL